VITLALYLRRFAEITGSARRFKGTSLAWYEFVSSRDRARPRKISTNLEDIVGQIIHSNTCLVSRNVTHLCSHFGVRAIPRALFKGELATRAVLIVESDRPKRFIFLREFLNVSLSLIDWFAKKNKDVGQYLATRQL
jgi:hypothetical protein